MTNAISIYPNEHMAIPLTNAPACPEGDALFYASAYVVPNHSGVRHDILVGRALPDSNNELMDRTNNVIAKKYSTGERYTAAALIVVRFCLEDHPDEENPDFVGPRMELGQSLVAADPDTPHIPVPTGVSRRYSYHHATRLGSDICRRTHPLMLPWDAEAKSPSEIVAVPQQNTYVYVAVNGTEAFTGKPDA